jgi:hypothetical protein
VEVVVRVAGVPVSLEPYASADRVFWVVDNGSSHRGQASVDRIIATWPTARLIHTPVHASWLNQCEIYFSVVQRKVVSPTYFYDLTDVREPADDLPRPVQPRRQTLNWKYTKNDLNDLLARIAAHEPTATPVSPRRINGEDHLVRTFMLDQQQNGRPVDRTLSKLAILSLVRL